MIKAVATEIFNDKNIDFERSIFWRQQKIRCRLLVLPEN